MLPCKVYEFFGFVRNFSNMLVSNKKCNALLARVSESMVNASHFRSYRFDPNHELKEKEKNFMTLVMFAGEQCDPRR